MCLKESCFPDCWKVALVVPVFKNAGERSTAKNYFLVSLLSMVSKVFGKLGNNMALGLLDQLLTVVSDRTARAFNRPFYRVWHAGLLHKVRCYEISGQTFGLISSFLSNRRLRVVLDGKSSQEYPVNAGVHQGSILGPMLFLLYINDLSDDVICNIAIYADYNTFFSKCDQTSDL